MTKIQSAQEINNFQEGPIIETEQEQWWQEGTTRIKPSKRFLQTTKGKLILGSGLLLVIALIVIIINLILSVPPAEESLIDITNLEENLNYTPLQLRIKELGKQLEKADPAIHETPLPQVEMNILILSIEEE
jgi:hypothetical protein